MNMITMMIISLGVPLLALVALLIIWLYSKQKMKDQKYRELQKLKSLLPTTEKKRDWSIFAARMYPYLREIPLVRILLNKLYRRLGIIYAGNEPVVKTRAASYTMIVIGTMILVAVSALIFSDSWSTRLAIIVVTLYLGGFISDYYIGNAELKMLRDQDKMALDIRHEYHKTYMVIESMERVADQADDVIAAHAERITEVLKATDSEEELKIYYEVAPNRHMKNLAGLSYKVSEYGDSNVEEGEESFYLSSISNIREEIHMDITRRVKLNRLLSGIVFVAVSPIFLVDPIRRWSEHNFPIIANYYNSAWGMYSLVLLYLLFIGAFIILRYAKNLDADTQGVREEGKWLERLQKIEWIARLVNKVTPEEHEIAHYQAIQNVRKANSRLTVKSLYLWKMIFVIVVFVATIFVELGIHSSVRHYIVYPNEGITVASSQSSSQQMLSKERYAFESLLIGEIVSKKIPPNEVVPYILQRAANQKSIIVDTDMTTYAQQIADRVAKYRDTYYKWYELLVAVLVGGLSYFIPDIYLKIRQQARKWEMQNEVDGFTTSIMMLSQIERISVYEILEWMHRDSYIFQEQLTDCLLDYESGAWEALEALKDEVHFEPLERLIERLQEAVDRIPIKNAFDDMRVERAFAIEQRKEHYEKVTSEKVALGKAAGFTPLGATLVVYLFAPFIYLMFQQMGDLTLVTGSM